MSWDQNLQDLSHQLPPRPPSAGSGYPAARTQKSHFELRRFFASRCPRTSITYWVVDFRVVGMLLLHLLIVLLFFPPLLVVQCFQVFSSVVFFHHFVLLELLVPLFVIVLQIFSGLKTVTKLFFPQQQNAEIQIFLIKVASQAPVFSFSLL